MLYARLPFSPAVENSELTVQGNGIIRSFRYDQTQEEEEANEWFDVMQY